MARIGTHGEVMESPLAPWRNVILVAAILVGCRYYAGSDVDSVGDGISIDGAEFPTEIKMGGIRQQLTGGGTRTKYNVAKVYAVSLYLDSRGASGSLKRFAAKKPAAALYDAMIKGSFARTLYLQFLRSVSAEQVTEALADSLTKRMPTAAVGKFRDALMSVCPADVSRGTKLFFMCKADTMYMGVGAPATQATLKEKGACAALFDVYLGKAPISAPAKDGIGNGFAKRIYAFDSQ